MMKDNIISALEAKHIFDSQEIKHKKKLIRYLEEENFSEKVIFAAERGDCSIVVILPADWYHTAQSLFDELGYTIIDLFPFTDDDTGKEYLNIEICWG